MKVRNVVLFAAASVLTSTAVAGDEVHRKMKIAVVDGSADGEVRVELDSEAMDFDLHAMQVGENQAIVDAQGRTILVTREEDSFALEVEGKTIRLPVLDDDDGRVWIEGTDADVNVEVLHDETHEHDGDDVRIIKKKIEIRSDSPEA